MFFILSNEEPVCPICGGKLEKNGWVKRVHKKEGGICEWYVVEVRRCTEEKCGKCHRLLPDILVPYKHYDAGLIEAVIDGAVDENTCGLEDGPSPITMKRWRFWGERLETEAEGKLRSAAYRILDLPDEFLGTGISLLRQLKERLVEGWLSVTMRVIYNTGG